MDEFYSKVATLKAAHEVFAIATVVEVEGSASARTGSKAIFDSSGQNLLGWVGGGCAERFLGEQAVAAIGESKARVVTANLDDEIFGLGVVCGGQMRVFIEPVTAPEVVVVPPPGRWSREMETLARFYDWTLKVDASLPSPASIEDLVLAMAHAVGRQRSRSLQSLRLVKDVPAMYGPPPSLSMKSRVSILGRSRITEALARHFTLLGFTVRAVGPALQAGAYPSTVECRCLDESYSEVAFAPGEIVLVASHTAQDPALVESALKADCSYVGMIGSRKRVLEVLNHFEWTGKFIDAPLFVPAGLDIDARGPEEIALSLISEVLTLVAR